jgi:hypothetical protein
VTESETVELGTVRRYLLGSLFYAALYYLINLILWPARRSPATTILIAVLWGLIMQAFVTRGDRRRREGKERYAPVFYVGSGVLGLGLCGGCWLSATPRATGIALFGLLAGTAFSLYLLAYGVMVTRRIRARGAASGA